jgi:hypothetical protein
MTPLLPAYDPLPQDVASWLVANDWRKVSRGEALAALWSRGPQEVVQPLAREASDYALRFADMLRRLAAWEHKPEEALAQEMTFEASDVSEWRASGVSARDFTVPLEDGFDLIRGARNAFVAAANSAIHRRGYVGHGSLKVAREHAKTVRMGQTRRGSYIVPIISRIPGATEQPEDGQERFNIDVSAQPFERRVMSLLAVSLDTVAELAIRSDSEPTMRQVNESVGNGVSYELCSALSSVLEAESFGDVDVAFSWARRVANNPDIEQVSLPKESGHVIRRMAERLRGSDVVAEQVIQGHVRLHRREPEEDEGFVYVRASVGDKQRTIGMTLTAEQMHEALMAADEKKQVYVRGRLVREQGRAWRFESISEFGIAEAAPLAWGVGREAHYQSVPHGAKG